MRTVNNLFEAASKVDLAYLIGQSLFESSDDYIRIQQEQMMLGERADGTPIFNTKTGSEYYSPGYAKHKGKDSPIDLKDTGSFYAGFETEQESEGMSIKSSDHKNDMLVETYEPFLLNDQSKIEFIPIAQQKLIDNTVNEINKK